MSSTVFQQTSSVRAKLNAEAQSEQFDHTTNVRAAISGQPRIPLRAKPQFSDGKLSKTNGDDEDQELISGRRRGASRPGNSNGLSVRDACGRGDHTKPNFAIEVPPNGYAWWYIDGLSDCGRYAVSVIAFIGSVFSPWYKWSGRKNPENNICMNVALYGPGARWTMTDRGASALRQAKESLTIGPSQMRWVDGKLVLLINEIATPHGSRIKGTISIAPTAMTQCELPLTSAGTHVWRPFAPTARIAVDLDHKEWRWDGHGYFDANFGTRALEQDFNYWTWSRLPLDGGTACFYDVEHRDGTPAAAAYFFDKLGNVETLDAPELTRLRRSLWALRRDVRCDAEQRPRQVKHMLDAPFYCRSAIETWINGEKSIGVHEALDLRRFDSWWLRPMLAVRVPRRKNWVF